MIILKRKSSFIELHISINESYEILINKIIANKEKENISLIPTIKYDLLFLNTRLQGEYINKEREMLKNDEKIRKAKEIHNQIEGEILKLMSFKRELTDENVIEYKIIESIEKEYYDKIGKVDDRIHDLSYMNKFQSEMNERIFGIRYLLRKYIK